MENQFDNMSDAELDAAIEASEPTFEGESESGLSDNNSVSPASEESEEQPEEEEAGTGVDQSANSETDSEEDSTGDDQTDDNGPETTTETDEVDDEDTKENEDKGTTTDDKQSDGITKFQPLKANGKEYPIDSIDELYKMASAGVGAQQKFQAIAGHKRSIMAAEKAGVNIDEAVNFMANYKENPQNAIARLLQDNNIDSLDLPSEILEAKDYSVSDFEVSYDEVVGEIGDSPIFPKVQELLLTGWDEQSQQIFLKDPSMIRNLHEEMTPIEGTDKSMYDLVSPIAEKMKLSGDGRSDYEVYMSARAAKVQEIEQFEKTKLDAEAAQTPKVKPNTKEKKKAASLTGGTKAGATTLDFGAMSDAELDAFLDKA